MAGQVAFSDGTTTEELIEKMALETKIERSGLDRKSISQSTSHHTFTRTSRASEDVDDEDSSSDESRDTVDDIALPSISGLSHVRSAEHHLLYSSSDSSSIHSHSSSLQPTPISSATSPSIYTVDSFTAYIRTDTPRRPSKFRRLRSSVGTPSSQPLRQRPTVEPLDFRAPPEQPERRFVDSIGIVCPGVCDRPQCAHPIAHFVSAFRVCQPIEYTTALADHGLTYSDYSRLRTALKNFLTDQGVERAMHDSQESLPYVHEGRRSNVGLQERVMAQKKRSTFLDTSDGFAQSKRQATALNSLLEDITRHLRARDVPVVVCVSSFSLFAPHRISEAHIQILHAPLSPQNQSLSITPEARSGQRLSFVDPSSFASAGSRSVSRSRPKLESRNVSETTTRTQSSKHHHHASQNRDRSRPWPMWPNAIPSRKRQLMSDNVDRYGADPYFRACFRAGVNSHTQSKTYSKYMIEQEDDPCVNKRMQYAEASSRGTFLWDILAHGSKAWQEQFPCSVNRAKYEHNRNLEYRRTIEHGSRLRILRFGFRHTNFPPHTPEMEELGLSKDAYQTIQSHIADIHTHVQWRTKCPLSYMLSSINKIRRRSTEDALMKVSEYIRKLNASQRRIVWTIEKIPGVYDRGLARDRTEWEISAWNGEDPLELLIELERWGLIEKRLNIEDDE